MMQEFPNWQTSALWYGFNFYASCVASSILHGFGDDKGLTGLKNWSPPILPKTTKINRFSVEKSIF
jgi:hypothetical protein